MKNIAALLLLLVSSFAFAQFNIEDVVYLKSGSIIRGKITTPPNLLKEEQGSSSKISVELLGGSVFVFDESEIDSIKKESTLKNQLKEIKKNYFRRDRGFRNQTEFGIIYGANLKRDDSDPNYYYNNNPEDDFGISLHSINGYQVWPCLYVAAGVGIDRMISYRQTFSPFYLRVSSEFLKRRVTPYAFFDVGYAVMWKQKTPDYLTYQNKGGLYVSCGGGVRIYTRSRASVILSASYKSTHSETKWWYTVGGDGTIYNIKRSYQRLSINVGVTF